MQQKVLITGGSGLLAINWALSIRDNYFVVLILHERKISIPGVDSEVASLDSIKECLSVINKHQPNIVIHTAGLTNIEECQKNLDLAQKVNIDLAENIAVACNELDVNLAHISTDHLFSGEQQRVKEEEPAKPLNNYAKTKSQGELKVQECCKNALIVRTNFFGWGTKYRQSFSDFILGRLRSNKPVGLFQDVFFTPILIDELVSKVHQLIDSNVSGIFNIVSKDRLSKYEFGLKIAEGFELDSNLIKAINIDEKIQLTRRPKDMSLSNAKLCRTLQCEVSDINKQIQRLKEQEINNATNQMILDIIPYGRHYIDEDDV
jgi:dTDP-4-dehydrorhamnose reductase